MQSTKELRSKT